MCNVALSLYVSEVRSPHDNFDDDDDDIYCIHIAREIRTDFHLFNLFLEG